MPIYLLDGSLRNRRRNTCSDAPPPKTARIEIAYRMTELVFLWTAHPTASKIGQEVQFSGGNPLFSSPLPLREFSGLREYLPRVFSGFPFDRIVCDDYRWLPGGTATHGPVALLLPRWDGEFMLPNPETGIDENRIVGGAQDIELSVTLAPTPSV